MSLRSNSVHVRSGSLSGVPSTDGAVLSFKGVPYARPPVGALRWQPPQAPETWSGVRDAHAFGPRSIQPDRPQTSISYFGPERESEDCLYLNLWTAAASEDERRPVMVWFHGGAFQVGSGSLPIFDGENLARRGVIAVTVNQRLGALGFLAHPELSKQSGTSGNYGLLDQIAALAWVRDNIAAFGGDPDRVTIFGQSVGASSVCCLMASPLARGLFHRAIGQSGASVATAGRIGGGSLPSLEQAERRGLAFAKTLGAASLDDLRSRSAEDIQLKGDQRLSRGSPTYGTDVLPEHVHDIFLRQGQAHVPLLTGSNAEGSTRPAPDNLQAFLKEASDDLGAPADELVELYMRDAGATVADASRLLGGHRCFNWQNWAWARLHARANTAPVYYYHFSHLSPIARDRPWFENAADKLGAFHTAEIPYVFQTFGARNWAWRETDRQLSEILISYWTNFAANGDPNGLGLPSWEAFDRLQPRAMHFDNGATMGGVPDRAKLDAFDAFYARQSPGHAWTLSEAATAAE